MCQMILIVKNMTNFAYIKSFIYTFFYKDGRNELDKK